MNNFCVFLMFLLLTFYPDIKSLPSKICYYYFAMVGAVMLALAVINGAIISDFVSMPVHIEQEAAENNIILALGFVIFVAGNMLYIKRKELAERYKQNGYILLPGQLKGMLRLVRQNDILYTFWFILIGFFVMLKVIPDLESTGWIVFLGTVDFFVFVWVLFKLQNLFIDCDPQMEDMSREYLNELQTREAFSEEEQKLLKERFADAGIL